MNILAKSGCFSDQLEDRVNKGFQKIEIQLTKDFVENYHKMECYFTQVVSTKWDIQNIHMPLILGGDDINLEYLTNPKYLSVFFHVCRLAEHCAGYYKHPITIVIHAGASLKSLRNMPVLLSELSKIFYCVLRLYPHITFSIENICSYTIKHDYIRFSQNVFAENVELAKYFNRVLKTNRFYTTLDVCHILMTQKSLDFLKDESSFQKFNYDLDWFFKENKAVINNIHLNNMRNCGLNKMDHGASFDEENLEDMKLLDEIFGLYKKYNYTCNITLEVDELDYRDIKEAKKLKELIEKKYNTKE